MTLEVVERAEEVLIGLELIDVAFDADVDAVIDAELLSAEELLLLLSEMDEPATENDELELSDCDELKLTDCDELVGTDDCVLETCDDELTTIVELLDCVGDVVTVDELATDGAALDADAESVGDVTTSDEDCVDEELCIELDEETCVELTDNVCAELIADVCAELIADDELAACESIVTGRLIDVELIAMLVDVAATENEAALTESETVVFTTPASIALNWAVVML